MPTPEMGDLHCVWNYAHGINQSINQSWG